MADPYLDPCETQIYGKFAREQLAEVCLGRIPELDHMVQWVIAQQKAADKAMAEIMAKQPQEEKPIDAAQVTAEASEVIIRFGRHLESHKKGEIDTSAFFRGDVPSVLARRRLTKLSAGVQHVVSTLVKQKAAIREADYWIGEITPVSKRLQALEKQQRAAKVKKIDLGPEVEAGRQAWLAVYNPNKLLIRGLLAHAGKPELLPLIFDDLAEVHRAGGVSDEMPAGGEPDAPAEDAAPEGDAAKTPEG